MRNDEEVFSIFDKEEDRIQLPDAWAEHMDGKTVYKRPVYHPLPVTDRHIGLTPTYTLLPEDDFVLPRVTHRLYDNGVWFTILWTLDMVPAKPDFVTDRRKYLTEPIRCLGNRKNLKPEDWYDSCERGESPDGFVIIESHLPPQRVIEIYLDARSRLDIAAITTCDRDEWLTYFDYPPQDGMSWEMCADFELIESSKAIDPTINHDLPDDIIWTER